MSRFAPALLVLSLSACLAFAGVASAQPEQEAEPDPAMELTETGSVATYIDTQRRVREEISNERSYRKLEDATRDRLFAAQDKVFGLLEGATSFDALAPELKSEVRSGQQEVRAALLEVRGQKEVCWRERPLGSKIAEQMCATQNEIERRRRAAREAIESGRATGGR